MEPEALSTIGPETFTTIGIVFVLLCLFACRPTRNIEEEQEEEIEDSDIDEELTDEILEQLRAYAGIASQISVKRANGDVYEVKFRSDESLKVVHNVAAPTPEPSTRLVWSEDGRMLQRETLNWGGEQ